MKPKRNIGFLAATVAATLITGCAADLPKLPSPQSMISHKFDVSGVDDAYNKAVDCVYDVISGSAASGSLFDYESEARQKYAVTYQVSSYETYHINHTMIVGIKDGKMSVKFKKSGNYFVSGNINNDHFVYQRDADKVNASAQSLYQCVTGSY